MGNIGICETRVRSTSCAAYPTFNRTLFSCV